MGLRYHAMLPVADLSDLPAPARARVDASSRHSFVTSDRGNVRRNNDNTAASRSHHFARWLEAGGFTLDSLAALDPELFPSILGGYLTDVAAGDNLQRLSGLTSKTLNGYLSNASATMTLLTRKPCSYHDPATLSNKRPTALPMFAEILRQRSTWRVPLPRKEPFTLAMYDSLRAWLASQATLSSVTTIFLSLEYAVYDWARLGLFTGSRISEYGQTASHRSSLPQPYATIPVSGDAGIWSGQPLAFIAPDFTFYSYDFILLHPRYCLLNTALDHIFEVHIRFRFDKSKDNFTIRKYCRIPSAPFDPVLATINIIRRAHLLSIPAHEPLGQFRRSHLSCNSYLLDKHMRDVMRMLCRLAYLNPAHYCRLHIQGLVAHSTRVTAALCLQLGGASLNDIAFRLRWHVSSVPTYLCECFNGISDSMQTAVRGAFKTS